jgi:hypothetical protein
MRNTAVRPQVGELVLIACRSAIHKASLTAMMQNQGCV